MVWEGQINPHFRLSASLKLRDTIMFYKEHDFQQFSSNELIFIVMDVIVLFQQTDFYQYEFRPMLESTYS